MTGTEGFPSARDLPPAVRQRTPLDRSSRAGEPVVCGINSGSGLLFGGRTCAPVPLPDVGSPEPRQSPFTCALIGGCGLLQSYLKVIKQLYLSLLGLLALLGVLRDWLAVAQAQMQQQGWRSGESDLTNQPAGFAVL
ncbi:hypothetical protein T310_9592 [Rasamsonia emersonii CBS 393.64]|uniref:Uncharacterized protein n=1 Tax=Rasamsonia emersonii (strain ATCC 16479 / CBS 393.64 / IMI 116815) TaxID=1408163 RepID=A0A0F4YEX6_RASE3|nr:hypothetical protein T310_9592 [Rasamsonia emersonii CBS 393.64]KKA16772.1 hypothetical protein T310_9592 [Rasamsonia emersonii CBS 393.64]